jgi:hypothetical protein
VNSTKLWMTDRTPSAFGMPISGPAFGATLASTTGATAGCGAATTIRVRERAAIILAAPTGASRGDLGLVQSDFPGTRAWRPPTC